MTSIRAILFVFVQLCLLVCVFGRPQPDSVDVLDSRARRVEDLKNILDQLVPSRLLKHYWSELGGDSQLPIDDDDDSIANSPALPNRSAKRAVIRKRQNSTDPTTTAPTTTLPPAPTSSGPITESTATSLSPPGTPSTPPSSPPPTSAPPTPSSGETGSPSAPPPSTLPPASPTLPPPSSSGSGDSPSGGGTQPPPPPSSGTGSAGPDNPTTQAPPPPSPTPPAPPVPPTGPTQEPGPTQAPGPTQGGTTAVPPVIGAPTGGDTNTGGGAPPANPTNPAPAPTSIDIPVTTTDNQGNTITTSTRVPVPPGPGVTAGPDVPSSFAGEIDVATTDDQGNPITLSGVSFGEVVTATNARGRTFITTYTPGGGRISRVVLQTTTLPNGERSTITSFAPGATGTSLPSSQARGSSTQASAGLQSGAAVPNVLPKGQMAAVVGGFWGLAQLL